MGFIYKAGSELAPEIKGITVGEVMDTAERLLEIVHAYYGTDIVINLMFNHKKLCDSLDEIIYEYADKEKGQVSIMPLAVLFLIASAATAGAFTCVEYQEGLREINDILAERLNDDKS